MVVIEAVGYGGAFLLLLCWPIIIVRMTRRRARTIRAGPPTLDLRSEPPAVVNLLVNRLTDAPQASSATILDLAARHILEIIETPAGPEYTMVEIHGAGPSDLAPFERRVVDQIRAVGGAGPVRLTDLTSSVPERGWFWQRRLVADVRQEARNRGLIHRVDVALGRASAIMSAIVVLLVVVTGVLQRAWLEDPGASLPDLLLPALAELVGVSVVLFFPWFFGWAALMVVATFTNAWLNDPDRYTELGMTATAHWLGVAERLRDYPAFGELPAGAVAVWDKYLAYGAALDVTPHAARVLDMRTAGRQRAQTVWSDHTGRRRQVQVRYRRTRRRFVPTLIYADSRLKLVWAGMLLGPSSALAVSLDLVVLRPGHHPGVLWFVAAGAATLIAARYAYRAVRAAIDLLWPARLVGRVVAVAVAVTDGTTDSGHAGHGTGERAIAYHLAVDTGRSDVIWAWKVGAGLTWDYRVGDLVSLSGQRWSGWARHVRPVSAGL